MVKKKWRPDRDMVQVLMGIRGCAPRPMGHSLVTLFSLFMSVKDRPLHWTLGKSQTYYPEHILGYGRRKDLLLSFRGFRLFSDWDLEARAWSPSLDGDLDPLTGG